MASKQQQDPRFYVDIARVDEEERMVYGYGTREDVKDSYGTIIDLDSVRACLPEYLKWRNVREMHQPSAVGVADDVTIDDVGVMLGVYVEDDAAWRKVKRGVYKGFSIGGKKDYQDGDRIFLKEITEFSLVDRPSNTGCPFDEFRMYGGEGENGMDAKTKETPAAPAQEGEVKRGMYDVGTFGSLLQNLAYLASSAQDESAWEGDNSPVPAKLRAALGPLVEVYKEMAQEEVSELMAALAKSAGEVVTDVAMSADADTTRKAAAAATDEDGDEAKDGKKKKADADGDEEDTKKAEEVAKAAGADDDVTRAGKRNSSKDASDLQTIHDACCRLGALCGDDVKKADNPDVTRLAQLESDVTRLQGELDTLRSENAKLKEEPAAAKGVTRVVGKEDDSATAAKKEETKRMEEITDPLEAVKRIHQAGGQTITRL